VSSQEEVRKLADLRQWLEDKIKEMEEELDYTRQTLSLVDEQLKRESFVKAAAVPPSPRPPVKDEEEKQVEESETRPLRRQKDNYLIANAFVQGNQLTIVPVTDVVLRSTTPPFKSYLVGKVLGGMRTADEELASQGKLATDRLISFEFQEDGGRISKLTIRNFNDKLRLTEILNTSLWTFTKMLEKQA
jgi:hypothetical protein